jgi:hypothetical protein
MRKAGYGFRKWRAVGELVTHITAKNFEKVRGKI